MGKIIINNESELSDSDALNYVIDVINMGRISNNGIQYCYATVFSNSNGNKYAVWTDLNEKSDKFTVSNDISRCERIEP